MSFKEMLDMIGNELEEKGAPKASKPETSWSMFLKLWKVTPSDCKINLVREFVFSPDLLRRRFQNEINFQERLKSHWK